MVASDYPSFVEEARNDERVLGLVLTGSRGRGAFVRDDSDWDVRLVVRDDVISEAEQQYDTPHGSVVEVATSSLTQFEEAGMPRSSNEWDRYSYVRCEIVLDKLDGRIHELVAEKATYPAETARTIVERQLDAYINCLYRSVKNHANGLALAAHLDATESIPPLLTLLFALQRRVRPFNKFLEWELDQDPLDLDVMPRIRKIASTGDLATQQALFSDVERLARERGYGQVVDGWEPDLARLRG